MCNCRRFEALGTALVQLAEVTHLGSLGVVRPDLLETEFPPSARDESGGTGRCKASTHGQLAVPEGLVEISLPERWQMARSGGGVNAFCEPRSHYVVLTRDGEDGYISLDQRVRADGIPEIVRSWQPVDVAGREAYRTTTSGVERLAWMQDGVIALLESDTLRFDELLRMAESAELVSP